MDTDNDGYIPLLCYSQGQHQINMIVGIREDTSHSSNVVTDDTYTEE